MGCKLSDVGGVKLSLTHGRKMPRMLRNSGSSRVEPFAPSVVYAALRSWLRHYTNHSTVPPMPGAAPRRTGSEPIGPQAGPSER